MNNYEKKANILASQYNRNENKMERLSQNYAMNSQAIISQESQQTDNFLFTERDLIGRDSMQLQNGLYSNSDTQRRNQDSSVSQQGQKYNNNEDYENILEEKKDDQRQEAKTHRQNRKSSEIVRDLLCVDEQIEIIEDDESPTNRTKDNHFEEKNKVGVQSFQDRFVKKKNNEQINIFEQKEQQLQDQKDQQIELMSFNGKGISPGIVQKAKLKDEEQKKNSTQNGNNISETNFSRVLSMKSGYTNGQRLWSIVRRDIFYPIKFSGKIELGLNKKRKQKFRGSQSQIIFSSDPTLFIHPYGRFKLIWDLFIGAIQLYYPLVFPMRIAFGLDDREYYALDILLDFIFIIDMLFSCITGINQGGEIIKDRYYITKKYLQSYFLWDFLSILPYYFFEQELCYIKIFRLARYWDRYLLLINKTIYFTFKGGSSHKFAVLFYYLFKVTSLILICVHVMTCWWIEVGLLREYGETPDLPQEFKQLGWVTDYYLNNPNKTQYGQINKNIYISGFYYVTTTIATVGYGDFASKTVMESFFTMFCEFFGIALFGYISGGLVSAVQISLLVGIQKKNESKSEFDQWLYQREKNKQDPLYFSLLKNLRAINHFNSENNFSDFFNEQEYFHYLPKEQKRKVFNLIFTDIATFFGAFFRNISELQMIQDIFQYMHPLTFLPGGEIIKYRSLSRGLYFIVSGKVYIETGQVRKQQEQQIENKKLNLRLKKQREEKFNFRRLKPGSFFGEFCLLEKNSSFSFIAGGKEPLNILFITRKKLIDICAKYKETNSWLKKFAYYRFKYFKMEKYNYVKKLNIFKKSSNEKLKPSQNNKKSRFASIKNVFNRKKITEKNSEIVEDKIEEQDNDQEINSNLSEISENSNNLDQVVENYEQNEEINIQQIDSIVENHEASDLSINQGQKNKEIEKIFQNPPKDKNIEGMSVDQKNTQHIKKESLLDQMQKKEDQQIVKITQSISGQDKKRSAKSELEFFLQPEQYFTQQMKNHLKQQSLPQLLKRKENNSQINIKQNQIQQKEQSKGQNQHRSVSETIQQYRKGRFQSMDQSKNIVKNGSLTDKFKHQRHYKHLSMNNENLQTQQGKKKLSSNFQSLQINEFSDDQSVNIDYFHDNYQPEGIIGGQINVNQPYQFNFHNRDPNFNILSPTGKENDKLISTPFSSNQQTYTRDTINNQKLLYSDDDQNSARMNNGNHMQIQKDGGNTMNQRGFDDDRSQETEQFHSCIIEMDTDLEENPKHNQENTLDDKPLQSQPFQLDFINKKLSKNLSYTNESNQGGIQQNMYKKIDFSQFTKQQVDLPLQKGLFISILEKCDNEIKPNRENNMNQNQNEINNNQNSQDILSKIIFKEIQESQQIINQQSTNDQSNQKPIFAIDEIDEDHMNENQSQDKEKQDLIKFESYDNISLFIDEENEKSQFEQEQSQNMQNIESQQNSTSIQMEGSQKEDYQVSDSVLEQSENKQKNSEQEYVDDDDHQQNQKSASQTEEEDYMNSDEERQVHTKIKGKQLVVKRNDSVQKIKLIKEEEKKIRRAFRYLTTSNNKLELLQTKKQFQIAEKVGVKVPYVKQLSQSRFKKETQHKVMKKILNKKIQILVQTVMEKASSVNNGQVSGTSKKIVNNNSLRYISQTNQPTPTNRLNPKQFEEMMNSSPNGSGDKTPSGEQPAKYFTFNQAFSIKSSMIENEQNNQFGVKQCSSEYSGSPSNNMLFTEKKTLKVPSPIHLSQQENSSSSRKNISIPKSKFCSNQENKSPNNREKCLSTSINAEVNDQFYLDSSPINNMNSKKNSCRQIEQTANCDNIQMNDIINEDDNESQNEDSNDKENQNESDDNIEVQINQIYNSRVPNFQLMLYIDKMISQHKQQYQSSSEFFENDDYQCYEEIEQNEQLQQGGYSIKEQSALDNSIDIPIDIIKPNFEIQELFNLPSYLEVFILIIILFYFYLKYYIQSINNQSQISIIDNKLQSLIENSYDECQVCFDKIMKLNIIKQKKQLFIGTKDETDTNVNTDNQSHIQNRDHLNSINQQKITISNLINGSPQQPTNTNKCQLNQKSLQVEQNVEEVPEKQNTALNEQALGRVNLGHNIQFAIQNEKDNIHKDEYNFFTELERKNHLIQYKNSLLLDDDSPKIKKRSFAQTPKSKKHKTDSNLPMDLEEGEHNRFSDVVEKIKLPTKDKSNILGTISKKKISDLKVSLKENSNPIMSEQEKIKIEFQKMFDNMRSHIGGDKSPISMEMSDLSYSN